MGFLLRNISGSPLPIDDLGITIDTGADFDLTSEPADSISISAQVGGDLEAEVTGGGATVLDPDDDVTPLSVADSLTCLRAANVPHFRDPEGGTGGGGGEPPEYIQVRDTTGGQSITGAAITLNLNTIDIESAGDFSLASDEITFNNAGVYSVEAHVIYDDTDTAGGARCTVVAQAQENVGAGFVNIVDIGRGFGYHRETTENTVVVKFLRSFAATDSLRIQLTQQSGSTNIETEPGLSRVIVTKIIPGGGGGSTILVEDEGTPLVTAADTFNFVGAGVTASGTGTTKTIAIPGGGGGGGLESKTFEADQLENPNNPDWMINALAPLTADSNNNGFSVRLFDDTTEEGVGFTVEIPSTAANVVFDFVSRAETAPGAVRTVGLKMYEREIPDNAAPTAWSAGDALADIGARESE